MKRTFPTGLILLGAVALVLYPIGAMGATTLPLSLCSPGQTFSPNVTNPYYPLPARRQVVLTGEDEGELTSLRITVKGTARFYGGAVTTRVVEEFAWLDKDGDGSFDRRDDERIEVSQNYFAQADDGTVCYFGEVVDIYTDTGIVHDGSWRADANGHLPGIIMPAHPKPGTTYRQEHAPGIAMDEATILGSGRVTVPAGTFKDTIRTLDFNPLDGDQGYKWFARGTGLIIDGPLQLRPVS